MDRYINICIVIRFHISLLLLTKLDWGCSKLSIRQFSQNSSFFLSFCSLVWWNVGRDQVLKIKLDQLIRISASKRFIISSHVSDFLNDSFETQGYYPRKYTHIQGRASEVAPMKNPRLCEFRIHHPTTIILYL